MTHTITQEQLKKYIAQVKEFAEVLDEEGLDRDGLHFALYALIDAIEKQTENACGKNPSDCYRVRCHIPKKCCGVDVDGTTFSPATQKPTPAQQEVCGLGSEVFYGQAKMHPTKEQQVEVELLEGMHRS